MNKKGKPPIPDDPEQFKRFAELAEQVKTEDADERFEEAFGKIIKAKSQRRVKVPKK